MPTTTPAAIPPIVAWFQLYGNMVFFFAQLLWWIVTGFAAGWAASIYYRWFKMNQAAAVAHAEAAADEEDRSDFSDSPKTKDAKDEDEDEDVDVDKFVE
jgi:hypothetical protein